MEAIEQISLFSRLFYVAFGVAGIGLLLTVFLFFYYDIPQLFSLLTGKAMKKSLERMHEQSERGGSIREKAVSSRELKNKAARVRINESSGNLMRRTEEMVRQPQTGENARTEEFIPENMLQAVAPFSEKSGTTVLKPASPVGTALEEVGKTTLLSRKTDPALLGLNFRISEEIVMIHTEEII